MCVLYELYEIGLIHNPLLTKSYKGYGGSLSKVLRVVDLRTTLQVDSLGNCDNHSRAVPILIILVGHLNLNPPKLV